MEIVEKIIGTINLSPFLYTEKLRENQILENIVIKNHNLLSGTKVYTALVYFKKDLFPLKQFENIIYGSCHGTGTDINKNIAIYKGISEAIERWAFFSSCESERYGFNLDKTTNGMAAFPGVNYYQVKQNALAEALERWSVINFWEEHLPVRLINKNNGIELFEILSVYNDKKVALTRYFSKRSMLWAYGFAASTRLESAFNKALIELTRNVDLLNYLNSNKTEEIESISEKRLIYFSQNAGADKLNEKLEIAQNKKFESSLMPEVIVDEKIEGNWTKYTKVWRTLFKTPQSDDLDHFMF